MLILIGTLKIFNPNLITPFFHLFFRAPINILARSTTRVPEISGSTFSQTTASTPASINSDFQVVQSTTTVRPSDDERIETMTKLMKKEKNTKAITQFYPDYDYSEKTKEEEENVDEEVRVASPKIKSNSNKVCSKFLNSSTVELGDKELFGHPKIVP